MWSMSESTVAMTRGRCIAKKVCIVCGTVQYCGARSGFELCATPENITGGGINKSMKLRRGE